MQYDLKNPSKAVVPLGSVRPFRKQNELRDKFILLTNAVRSDQRIELFV